MVKRLALSVLFGIAATAAMLGALLGLIKLSHMAVALLGGTYALIGFLLLCVAGLFTGFMYYNVFNEKPKGGMYW
jgi:amino acid transporter